MNGQIGDIFNLVLAVLLYHISDLHCTDPCDTEKPMNYVKIARDAPFMQFCRLYTTFSPRHPHCGVIFSSALCISDQGGGGNYMLAGWPEGGLLTMVITSIERKGKGGRHFIYFVDLFVDKPPPNGPSTTDLISCKTICTHGALSATEKLHT